MQWLASRKLTNASASISKAVLSPAAISCRKAVDKTTMLPSPIFDDFYPFINALSNKMKRFLSNQSEKCQWMNSVKKGERLHVLEQLHLEHEKETAFRQISLSEFDILVSDQSQQSLHQPRGPHRTSGSCFEPGRHANNQRLKKLYFRPCNFTRKLLGMNFGGHFQSSGNWQNRSNFQSNYNPQNSNCPSHLRSCNWYSLYSYNTQVTVRATRLELGQ